MIDNQAAFCEGAPDDFEASCSAVNLGDELAATKKKFAALFDSNFMNLLQRTKRSAGENIDCKKIRQLIPR